MLQDYKNIASECIKNPTRDSVWSEKLGGYIYPDTDDAEYKGAYTKSYGNGRAMPFLSQNFKLIFLTAAGGTLFFAVLCVTLHLITGGKPPPLMDKLIQGMFDLVKIGFGSIVGLLSGKR